MANYDNLPSGRDETSCGANFRLRTLVEEDGDVVGGELLVGLPAGAGSDCSGFISGLVEILDECIRKMADVGAVPLDDKLGSAGLSLGHGAGLAGVLIRWRGWEAAGLKKLCGCPKSNGASSVPIFC